MTTLSLREAIIIFEDELPDIRTALLSNAAEVIKEYSPYKELTDDNTMTVQSIPLHINFLAIEEYAKPLLNTVRRIDSYRIHKDTPQSAGFITDMDIQNAKSIGEDWFIYEAELNHKKVGKCPFHTDTKPSLTLIKSKQNNTLYLKCFVCNEAWDSIGYIMARDNLSFMEAVKVIRDSN